MSKQQPVNPARLQFSWGASPDAPGAWFMGVFCFFRRAKSPLTGNYYVPVKSSQIYPLALLISVRGLLLWFLGLGFAIYFGGAALLLHWLDQRPLNRITYSDLVLPWRWSGLGPLRGRANLDQAEADLKNGNIRSAFAYLRSGLARYPDDPKARLELASLYVLFRLRGDAEKTLIDAFNHTYPGGDYLQKAVSLIEPGDNPEFLVAFCERGRAALAAADRAYGRDARFLDGVRVKTLIELDRADEAVALIEKYQAKDFALLQMAKVASGFVHSDFVAAEAALDAWLAVMPDAEPALTAAVRVYRAAGKVPEMQAAILRLRSRYPNESKHIRLALSETLLAGQVQAAYDLLDVSVIRFVNQPASFGEWAEAIGETGHDEVLARLEQLVREINQNPQTVIFARMMAQIRQRDWPEAEASSARLDALYPQVHERLQSLHRVAKALLKACSDPAKGAQNTLANTITGGWVGMALYAQIVDALAMSERYEAALEVLTLAEGYFPTSRYIAAQRTVITEKLQAQNAAPARTSSENTSALVAGPAVPADAKAFFAALDVLHGGGPARVPEALRLVRAVRKDAPAWLQAALPELEWREIQLAAQVDDLSLLQLNLRTYLRSRPEALADAVTAQALAWNADNRRAAALIAVREVIRVHPEHKEALRLLVEWSPRQTDGGSDASNASAAASPGQAAVNTPLPGSAEELFAVLDAQADASRNTESLRLLRSVRKADPAWLAAALPEVEWREILLAAEADDLSLLLLNIRTYLRLRPTGVERCLEQARTWHGHDKKQAAMLVVRETLLQYPDQPSAKKLLSEWSKP